MIVVQDWRQCGAAEVGALLRAEAAVWQRQLGWDTTESWSVIEPARAAGALPGFVARDSSGQVVGWTWFLLHRGCLQIAALVAAREEVVRALLDAIMESEAARAATACVCSVRGTPPGMLDMLAGFGLRATTYAYQIAVVAPGACPAPEAGRSWQSGDGPAMTALLARAYPDTDATRPFAPRGTHAEWRDYLHGLVGTHGCGVFQPGLSVVVDGPARSLSAGLLASLVDRDVAHVSQVVVDPDEQGRGLGLRVVQQAMAGAAARGVRRVTLLVATGNRRARSMYATLGFADRAAFVVASSSDRPGDQPRRLTSVALATGGVSTRR
jgi:ribosomal protein S18 acetylase RimI-like enzyme